jgi:hypothetical protein
MIGLFELCSKLIGLLKDCVTMWKFYWSSQNWYFGYLRHQFSLNFGTLPWSNQGFQKQKLKGSIF